MARKVIALPLLFSGLVGTAWAQDEPGDPFYVPGEPVYDDQLFAFFYGNRLEVQSREGSPVFLWDVDSWVGQDYNRIWLKTEGELGVEEGKLESGTVEPLYSRPVSAYWDVQAGVRYEAIDGKDDRVFASLGVQGLAPGFFEVDPTLLISSEGDVSLTAEVEYDQYLTQRLIVQPRLAFGFQAQDVPEYDLGAGFTSVETGLRLRYEVSRKFAPYVGVNWVRSVGETASRVQESGEDAGAASVVGGLRVLF